MESKAVSDFHIPFFGLKRQYANLREEILEVTDQVYHSGKVLDGNFTSAFERDIAYRCNRSYALAVNSCSQGLIFAQLATVRTEPRTVLIPTVSFIATLNSVLMNGMTPRFCEIDHKGLMDLSTVDYKLDDEISAVMYVNLFGNTVDWDKFRMQTQFFNDKVYVIEDAAQSFGASYKGIPSGKMGDVSVLSFDPTKNLPNYGSGGMILTDDYNIYATCKDLRDNGKSYSHSYPGTNSKMSESDCAQMRVKLKYFDAWQKRRTEIAEYYINELYQYIDIIMPNEGVTHAWHKFVMRVENRSGLIASLEHRGIDSRIHYSTGLHDEHVGQPHHRAFDMFHETEQFTKESLSLPIYPELTDGEVETIAQVVKTFCTE